MFWAALLLKGKDTHMEETSSNKNPAFTEDMNIAIWVAGTSNQIFI